MSKILDALRRAEAASRGGTDDGQAAPWQAERPFRVVSVVSNKGGVGKTTVASNLAVYLKALREEAPVLVFGFDDQTTLDRMFALDATPPAGTIADGLREKSLRRVCRFGQYGVDYVPSSRDVPALRALLDGPAALQEILLASERTGDVVIDTKSDFETLTRSAILSSDLTIVVVKDHASLVEAERAFELLEKNGRPRDAARILLSLVDLRVKYREGEDADVLAHLLSEIRRIGYPVFETFMSRSPKVESLYTNPDGRALAILQGANQSVVHRQMIQLTQEVDRLLGKPPCDRVPDTTSAPAVVTMPDPKPPSGPPKTGYENARSPWSPALE